MADTDVRLTAGELTDEHLDWEIAVPDPDIYRRTIDLRGIRTWTYDGRLRVGLLDSRGAYGPWIGTEYTYASDTPVTLVQKLKPLRRPRRSRRRAA